MYHYFEAITNTSGDSLVGYFARVIDPVSLNTITLYADNNGTPIVTKSGVEDMASTDAYGNLNFYVLSGTYHLDIYAPNATSFIMRVSNVAMSSNKGDQGEPGEPGATGSTGPADNTYTTYADLLASDPTRKSARLVPGPGETEAAGNFAYLNGAWVRQGADGIAYNGGTAKAALDLFAPAATNVPYAATAARNVDMSLRPLMRPNGTVQAAILAGTLNICVVGDSIQEPAGIAYSNSVTEALQRTMQARFPFLTVNVTNLSIPGRAMSQLASGSYTAPGSFVLNPPTNINTSYWPQGSTAGKSWRDHVRDANPDIIVLALGENDGDDVLPFSINYQTFVDYSQTWTKKPWFTLVSGLTPEGSTLARQGAKARADFLLYTAIEQGFGSINAAGFYNLVRDGMRRDLVPFTQENDFQYWGDTSRWGVTGSLALSGTSVTGGGIALRNVAARDIDWSFNFTLTSADAIMRVDFNNRPTESGFSLQADFAGGYLRLYYRGILQAAPAIPTKANGATIYVRVKRVGQLILVWFDRIPVLSVRRVFGMESGPLSFGTAQGTGTFASSVLTYTPEYQAASSYFAPGYLLNDGLHHPTAPGAFQTYIPATKQFVDEFANLLRQPLPVVSSDSADVTYPTAGSQVLTTPTLTFTLATACTITVRIRFGYKNTNTGDGTLTLRLDGTGIDTMFLPPTTGANNRQLSYTVEATMAAGTHTLDLVEGAPTGATAGITSTGAGNLRSLAATVQIV